MPTSILGRQDEPFESSAYFCKVLNEKGVTLFKGEILHQVDKDKNEVVKKLSRVFKSDLMHPAKAREFMSGLTDYLEDDVQLAKALKPTRNPEAETEYQDSLVKLLLQVEDLQPELINWLLEKLIEIAMKEEPSEPFKRPNDSGMSPTQLILSALSWMNHVFRGQELADKVGEVIELSPEKLQREVIIALPEIVEEAYHSKIAMLLRDTMKNKPSLTNVVLHAFTYLNINADAMEEVRSSILKTLGATRSEDLPIVVRFLIEDLGKDETFEVVETMRENINFARSRALSQQTQGPNRMKRQNDTKDVDTLVMHILKMSMFSNSTLCNAWLKVIDGVKSAAQMRTIDVLIIFILHSFPTRRKATESLVKNKIRSGVLTERLIRVTLSSHSVAIQKYFKDLLDLSDLLLNCPEKSLNSFALVLYRESFLNLDACCKQEVVGDLVTKCCCGIPERSTTLKVLSELCFKHTEDILRYACFLENILDHSHTFTLTDLRDVMDILFFICYNSKSKSVLGMRNTLHIMIRKQTSSVNPNVFKMGVIGTVFAIKNMSMSCDELDQTMPTQQSQQQEDSAGNILKRAKKLLYDVFNKCKLFADASGLLMDELSNTINLKRVDRRLEKWISYAMAEDFTKEFIVDLEEDGSVKVGELSDFLPQQAVQNLEDENAIALNICPLVINNYGLGREKCTKIHRVLAHFRLLKICTAAVNNNNLEDIDGLLCCPLIMPKKEVTDKFGTLSKQEKEVTLSSLFYAANWYIELINAFASVNDADLHPKVLLRLKALLQLKNLISLCLKYETKFIPPKVEYLSSSLWQPPGTSSKNTVKGKGKGKKRKASGESQLDDPDEKAVDDMDHDPPVDMSAYVSFFRELDLDAFCILSYDTVFLGNSSSTKDAKMEPPEFLFLIKDLHEKLKHSLLATKSKKGFPGKGNNSCKELAFSHLKQLSDAQVASFGSNQIDYLLGNMDVLTEYSKELLQDNGGVADSHLLIEDKTVTLLECYNTVMLCIRTLLEWNGMAEEEHQELLKEILLKIGRRYNSNVTQNMSVPNLAKSAFDYFFHYTDSVINMTCAESQVLLLEILQQFGKDEEREMKMLELTREYLKREWFDDHGKLDKGARFNVQLESLLRVLFNSKHEISVEEFNSYVDEELMKIAVQFTNKKAFSSEVYKTFSKVTFPLHFRIFVQHLVTLGKSMDKRVPNGDKVKEWTRLWSKFSVLLDACKEARTRPLVASILKFARHFIELFIKECLPVMDKIFTTKREVCLQAFPPMQRCTRYLHHVCSYCKSSKDLGLSRSVPLLKRALETIIYKVKAILINHDAVECFQIGTLKNRDLAGEIIHSQTLEVDDDEDEETDDLPPDDDESEVEMDDSDERSVTTGDSEMQDVSLAI